MVVWLETVEEGYGERCNCTVVRVVSVVKQHI